MPLAVSAARRRKATTLAGRVVRGITPMGAGGVGVITRALAVFAAEPFVPLGSVGGAAGLSNAPEAAALQLGQAFVL